jgi:maltose O-acetyltransferase
MRRVHTPLHPFDAERRRREEFGKAIDNGSDVWVGGGAIILAGISIDSQAVWSRQRRHSRRAGRGVCRG